MNYRIIWVGRDRIDANLPLKHSANVGSGRPSFVQSQQSSLEGWRQHNHSLWSVFLTPIQNFSCCNTWLLPLVLPMHLQDKPLFIQLLDFGSSAL